MIIIGPVFQPYGRMEDVLNAVHNHGRVRHFGKLHNALQAEQLGAVRDPQQLKEHFERAGGNRLVRAQNERTDVGVMPGDVMVVMAMTVRIGFGGQPFPDVRYFPVGIV